MRAKLSKSEIIVPLKTSDPNEAVQGFARAHEGVEARTEKTPVLDIDKAEYERTLAIMRKHRLLVLGPTMLPSVSRNAEPGCSDQFTGAIKAEADCLSFSPSRAEQDQR